MKYCPTCETRYDEDILRFCMKDGTPLLEEAEPNFVEMPSKSLDVAEVDPDDPSEHTVIRRNIPVPPPPAAQIEQPPPPPSIDDDFSDVRPNSGGQRILVPTIEEQRRERARVAAQYQTRQPRSGVNTALIILVTIFGTIIVVGLGGIVLYFLVSNGSSSNTNANVNANQDVNANTNLGANANFDFNTNSGHSNVNANISTPTPSPSPTATPRPTESPSPTPDDGDSPTPAPSRTPIATPTPIVIRPGTSPTPLRTPAPTPRTIITPTVRSTP